MQLVGRRMFGPPSWRSSSHRDASPSKCRTASSTEDVRPTAQTSRPQSTRSVPTLCGRSVQLAPQVPQRLSSLHRKAVRRPASFEPRAPAPEPPQVASPLARGDSPDSFFLLETLVQFPLPPAPASTHVTGRVANSISRPASARTSQDSFRSAVSTVPSLSFSPPTTRHSLFSAYTSSSVRTQTPTPCQSEVSSLLTIDDPSASPPRKRRGVLPPASPPPSGPLPPLPTRLCRPQRNPARTKSDYERRMDGLIEALQLNELR